MATRKLQPRRRPTSVWANRGHAPEHASASRADNTRFDRCSDQRSLCDRRRRTLAFRTTQLTPMEIPNLLLGQAAVEPLLSRNLRERSAIFEGVTAAQMIGLESVCHERRFAPGELIFSEGAWDPFVYVLIDGVAQVTKTTSISGDQMRMAELRSGDVLGELKIVDPQSSSASVVAVTQVTALAMDLDTFAGSAALTAVRATLLRNAGRILAAKLRVTTSEGADAMQRELDEIRARVHAGRFIVLMFAMVATYQLAFSALILVPGRCAPQLRSSHLSLFSAQSFPLCFRFDAALFA